MGVFAFKQLSGLAARMISKSRGRGSGSGGRGGG